MAGQFEKFPLPQLFGAVFATTAGAGLTLMLLVEAHPAADGERALG